MKYIIKQSISSHNASSFTRTLNSEAYGNIAFTFMISTRVGEVLLIFMAVDTMSFMKFSTNQIFTLYTNGIFTVGLQICFLT